MFTLRRTGFGRLLYAVGDNERATRISGVLYWQVILALYLASALLAAVTGLLYVGLIKAPSLSLVDPLLLPSVAAAVIGGTSIFGGRGGYAGTILGALILTVLTTLLDPAADARRLPPHPLRRDHPVRDRGLPAHRRGPVTQRTDGHGSRATHRHCAVHLADANPGGSLKWAAKPHRDAPAGVQTSHLCPRCNRACVRSAEGRGRPASARAEAGGRAD